LRNAAKAFPETGRNVVKTFRETVERRHGVPGDRRTPDKTFREIDRAEVMGTPSKLR
jgi:hypothetical protein